MTAVEDAGIPPSGSHPPALNDRDLQRLAKARVLKLTKLVLPPSHEPVLEVMGSIWVDGLEAGLQLTEQTLPAEAMPEDLYELLQGAELCSEYDEFPELDDRDFQNLAYSRAQKLGRMFQPAGHPEMSGYVVEIWMDGVAAALRIVKHSEPENSPAPID